MVNLTPRTGHEGPEGQYRYSSTLSLTSVLDGGGWSTPRPGRLTTGKETQYPSYRRLGGPRGRSGEVRNISPSPGFDPRTLLPVASRYTDGAIPVHNKLQYQLKLIKTPSITTLVHVHSYYDFILHVSASSVHHQIYLNTKKE